MLAGLNTSTTRISEDGINYRNLRMYFIELYGDHLARLDKSSQLVFTRVGSDAFCALNDLLERGKVSDHLLKAPCSRSSVLRSRSRVIEVHADELAMAGGGTTLGAVVAVIKVLGDAIDSENMT